MLHAFILMLNIYYTLHCVILTQLLNKVLIGVSKFTEFLSHIKNLPKGMQQDQVSKLELKSCLNLSAHFHPLNHFEAVRTKMSMSCLSKHGKPST